MGKSIGAAPLTIGRLAAATGANIETIRYYEKIGMFAKPDRSRGGYRHYARKHVDSLNFICRARELGFPLATIRDLIRLNEGGACCEQARAVTMAHRQEVRRKIADLKRLDRELKLLIDECQPDRWPTCPIMDALSKDH